MILSIFHVGTLFPFDFSRGRIFLCTKIIKGYPYKDNNVITFMILFVYIFFFFLECCKVNFYFLSRNNGLVISSSESLAYCMLPRLGASTFTSCTGTGFLKQGIQGTTTSSLYRAVPISRKRNPSTKIKSQ